MKSSRRYVAAVSVLLMMVFGFGAVAQATEAVKPPGVVNLNTASVDQLMLLPGIGAKRAGRIVRFRQTKPFKRVVELARVKGIGVKTVRKLKVYLVVDGATTLSERPPRST
jgi:competence protein ComEA